MAHAEIKLQFRPCARSCKLNARRKSSRYEYRADPFGYHAAIHAASGGCRVYASPAVLPQILQERAAHLQQGSRIRVFVTPTPIML